MLNGLACVWWLDQEDCEVINASTLHFLPHYMRDGFEKLYGRNGRGRLWIPYEFGHRDFEVKENSFNGSVGDAVMRCAGMVVLIEDLKYLKRFPGLVTDFELNAIRG